MTDTLLDYFSGDELAASVWKGKYALKNGEGEVVEQTPRDMHIRMARELARAEAKYPTDYDKIEHLSHMGAMLMTSTIFDEDFILGYLDRFKYIIPQGSIMSALGNRYKLLSLSNCFVIPSPLDSYGGIFKTDQEIAQLEKRRGGVGTNLNTLAPEGRPVLNAAGTSTGAHSFMGRYSNTTREVAQNGRRGALMLLMSVLHPDIFKFVTKKKDRTKVTGANISSQLTNSFMKAVQADSDFVCRFPITMNIESDAYDIIIEKFEYNKLVQITKGKWVMKIRAKELFDLIVEMAWENAEPGVAFMDTVLEWSPDGVYAAYQAIASNPCGEQWLQAYDACRLIAANLYNLVKHPFQKDASIDYELAYEVFYVQQRLADDIVDLEIEYVDRIIEKIENDPEPEEVKSTELNLWRNVREVAHSSRRTGCGFTALADMLAALNLKYDSEEALDVVRTLMRTKLRAELDCTIDLAILRGTFTGWDFSKEIGDAGPIGWYGQNAFYDMLLEEFNPQVIRMSKHGRRNVSWSTIAPTGSLSIIAILTKYANTSGGMEPSFLPFYFRNKKVNPSDGDVRVDFVDQSGDSWQTYPVVMGGFKEWYDTQEEAFSKIEDLTKEEMEYWFKQSPYYGACANDISWEKRIEMQSILQRYTTNAISSTLNLPKDVSKEIVAGIYMAAWKAGLKGVTVYRDGCRTGVMVSDNQKQEETFKYHDSPKRPKVLDAELSVVTVKGKRYYVAIGFLNGKPYETFAFDNIPYDAVKAGRGKIIKHKKGVYNFEPDDKEYSTLSNIQEASEHADEQMLTRLVSGMMRHGINPKFIVEQINKCPLEIVSFGKAISRVIKKYIPEKELIEDKKCNECGSTNIRLAEGCVTCNDCGGSKCG
jgi:ribonucleoside-diphosphate reductase alpha chain